ncbi:hypothetical protein HK405_001112, partial [Cladochytrium tenue]
AMTTFSTGIWTHGLDAAQPKVGSTAGGTANAGSAAATTAAASGGGTAASGAHGQNGASGAGANHGDGAAASGAGPQSSSMQSLNGARRPSASAAAGAKTATSSPRLEKRSIASLSSVASSQSGTLHTPSLATAGGSPARVVSGASGNSSDLLADSARTKRPSILYRIFHPSDVEAGAGVIMGKSRRTYNSDSEFSESEDDGSVHSDASEDAGRRVSLPRSQQGSSQSAATPSSVAAGPAQSLFESTPAGQHVSLGRHTMSMSKSAKYDSDNSESEADDAGPRAGRGGRASIFKDLLQGGRASLNRSKHSSSASHVDEPPHAPSAAATSPSVRKASDSESEDHHGHATPA